MKILLVIVTLLFVHGAFATGGMSCSVDDENVKLDISLATGRVFGSPILANSVVDLELKKEPLIGFNTYSFKKSHNVDEIPYYYNLNNELRLGAYAEPTKTPTGEAIDVFVSVAVIVEGSWKDSEEGGYYSGTYSVEQTSSTSGLGFRRSVVEGYIRCEAE